MSAETDAKLARNIAQQVNAALTSIHDFLRATEALDMLLYQARYNENDLTFDADTPYYASTEPIDAVRDYQLTLERLKGELPA